jgi:hypothetical protein
LKTVPAIRVVDEVRGISGMVGEIGQTLKGIFREEVAKRIRYIKLKLTGKLRNQKQ